MGKLSETHKREIRKYNADLLTRVKRARCPRCGARPGKPCRSTMDRDVKWTHWSRHNEAKRLGHVTGSWFDEKKYGVTI